MSAAYLFLIFTVCLLLLVTNWIPHPGEMLFDIPVLIITGLLVVRDGQHE